MSVGLFKRRKRIRAERRARRAARREAPPPPPPQEDEAPPEDAPPEDAPPPADVEGDNGALAISMLSSPNISPAWLLVGLLWLATKGRR